MDFSALSAARTALFAALLSICAVIAVPLPLTAVPVTLLTLGLFLTGLLLPPRYACTAALLHLLLGTAGLPVFSGFSGGMGRLLGPTGGFIVGMIPAMIISGVVIKKNKGFLSRFIAFMVGNGIIYVSGTVWFCLVTKSTIAAAIGVCVAPFVIADVLKIVIVMVTGPWLERRIRLHLL